MRFRAVLFLACACCLTSLSCAGRLSASRQKLEVQKHLNRLNKPPVKIIESPDGDTIDCVHISHQPAFDHPFLKDHKMQTSPSYHPEGLFEESKVSTGPKEKPSTITQLCHMNGMCPEDTIPIRRTKIGDVLRASSTKRYGRKKHASIPKPRSADPDLINESGHQHAIAYVQGDKYFGAKATINVWEPKIQQANEFSLSQIWVLTTTLGSSLIGLVMHIKQLVATTFCARDLFKSTVILVFLSGRIKKKGTGGCNMGGTIYWATGHLSCSQT